jgi:hypothetical protein
MTKRDVAPIVFGALFAAALLAVDLCAKYAMMRLACRL